MEKSVSKLLLLLIIGVVLSSCSSASNNNELSELQEYSETGQSEHEIVSYENTYNVTMLNSEVIELSMLTSYQEIENDLTRIEEIPKEVPLLGTNEIVEVVDHVYKIYNNRQDDFIEIRFIHENEQDVTVCIVYDNILLAETYTEHAAYRTFFENGSRILWKDTKIYIDIAVGNWPIPREVSIFDTETKVLSKLVFDTDAGQFSALMYDWDRNYSFCVNIDDDNIFHYYHYDNQQKKFISLLDASWDQARGISASYLDDATIAVFVPSVSLDDDFKERILAYDLNTGELTQELGILWNERFGGFYFGSIVVDTNNISSWMFYDFEILKNRDIPTNNIASVRLCLFDQTICEEEGNYVGIIENYILYTHEDNLVFLDYSFNQKFYYDLESLNLHETENIEIKQTVAGVYCLSIGDEIFSINLKDIA